MIISEYIFYRSFVKVVRYPNFPNVIKIIPVLLKTSPILNILHDVRMILLKKKTWRGIKKIELKFFKWKN